ncbi:MAG: hypothetical protein EBS76_10885, partial [Actinobacteria bacterium]|nr:hypothetical protein [Actinomycetota bacterium]
MGDFDPYGKEASPKHRFGAEYYRKFYGKGGVHDRRKIAQLASAVHHMCAWWDVAPRSVLDVGAGLGLWRDWYRTTHPRVKVVSTDISEHACAKYGHEHRDIATWTPSRQFDLVICNLYPFLETLRRTEELSTLIENIDIGGVSLLRAAAKNFSRVGVLCDPADYKLFIESAQKHSGALAGQLRVELALKALSETATYDEVISLSLRHKLHGITGVR